MRKSVCKAYGITGSLFSVVERFLSDQKHCCGIDCEKSVIMDVALGVPHGSVLFRPCSFATCTADMFSILENQWWAVRMIIS